MAANRIQLGIVGLGPHFREELFPSLCRVISEGEVGITAVCDSNETSLGWARRNQVLTNVYVADSIHDRMFWSLFDCVICCASPEAHELVITEAIEHSCHCLCEKPVAASSQNLNAILEHADLTNLVLKVGHVFRYRPGGRAFIEAVKNQNLNCLNVGYVGSLPHGGRWGMSSRKAFSLTHLTHAIDFITASAGEIESVCAVAWSSSHGKETVTAVLKTSRCPAVTLWATNAAPAFCLNTDAVLENGSAVRMENLKTIFVTGLPGHKKRSGPWSGTAQYESTNDFFADEIRDVISEIRGTGKSLLPSLSEAGRVLAVIEEIEGRG